MSNLNNKVAVVTGGNSGIGFASAKRLKEQGAKVIIVGRSAEKVETAAKELGAQGVVADVKNLDAIDKAVEQIKAEYGGVDILVVNAGVFFGTPIGQTSEDLYDDIMDINFKGAVFTIEKISTILNEGASIVNIASIVAYSGMPNGSVYAASKAALNAYTRSAAVELAPRGIRVNSVNPGPINTPIYSKTGMNEEQIEGFSGSVLKRALVNRFGSAEEVAKVVTFLASDDASYITGSEYNVDGGVKVDPLLVS